MKGAIEYLQAVRDICQREQGHCNKCPLMTASEYFFGCPIESNPRNWTNGDILAMLSAAERAIHGTNGANDNI